MCVARNSPKLKKEMEILLYLTSGLCEVAFSLVELSLVYELESGTELENDI
jgi:hypothetical protein